MKWSWFFVPVASLLLLACTPDEPEQEAPATLIPVVQGESVDTPSGTPNMQFEMEPQTQSRSSSEPETKPTSNHQRRRPVSNKPPLIGPAPEGVKDQAPGYRPKDALYAKLDSQNRERQRRHDSIRAANGGVTPPRKRN